MRRKPKSRLTPHSKSVLKSERVKGSLRRFAPLTRGGVVLRAEKKTAAKEGCSRACAQPECASTQNSSNPRERIFFITPQTRTAPGKNAFGYGGSASGLTIGEYDQSGAAIREYVWLGSTPIAMFTPDPANAANPPLVYYIHADHLDAPRIVVDRSDNLRWRWMAEPFGTTAPENNPSGLGVFTFNLRFPGQYFDQESGLQDNWHRSYDSTLGRYTAPDPLGLAGGDVSLYSYVNGQPTEYTDPEGLNPALALYRAGMTGYRIGQAIEPWVAPYLAAAIDAVFLPDPMNENLILAQNNKQIRKRIAGLEKHIEIHKKKLDQEPDCDAANHWRNEIKAAENEIARLRLRLPNGK